MVFKFFLQSVFFLKIACFLIICVFADISNGQTKSIKKGEVTGLPLPRFVSVKSNKVNVRRGPNSTYQIDWVYTRAGVPLKIIAEFDNWRKVEDFQGEGGWIHSRLLSGKRYLIILDNKTVLKRKPNKNSPAVAIIEKGVIGRLVSITGEWREIYVGGHSGWVLSKSTWGTFQKPMSKN